MFTGPVKDEINKINEKRSKVAAQQALYEGQAKMVEDVQNLIKSFQGSKGIQTSVSLAIPNGEQIVGALRQIDAISKEANVALTSVKFSSASSRITQQQMLKKLGALKIGISVGGGYANLKDFLRKIETTVRIANVKSFSFGPGKQNEAGGDSLGLEIEMYYQM